MHDAISQDFLKLFKSGRFHEAKSLLQDNPDLLNDSGYKAHPLLREFVNQNHGHCHKPAHLKIAELLIPAAVLRFRDAVLNDRINDIQLQLSTDPDLVNADFTAGRGIARAVHHWTSIAVGELLLDAGADINDKTTVHHVGETPLTLKLRFGNLEEVRFLLERGANPNLGIIKHIPSKYLEEQIKLLLKHGWDINEGAGKRTLLHHDAGHGHGARIQILLHDGADPNIKDSTGKTALHLITARGVGRETIAALVKAGADINAVDDRGNTPLDYARTASHSTAAKVLISLGAKDSN